MKIVACLMVHNEDWIIDEVLRDLAKYTDEFYINLNEPTKYVEKVCKNNPFVKKFIVTKDNGSWDQGLQRDNTIRLLDDVQPDIVLFPDSDETFPKELPQILEDFWKSDKKYIWFRMWYYWNDKCHIRNDGLFKSMHHCRVFKWESGLVYIPYVGYALPTNFTGHKEWRYAPDYPIHHWGYMRKEDRLKKYERDKAKHYIDESKIKLVKVCK